LPRRDPAGAGRQGRSFLLDVRAEILLDEDHAGRARLRRGRGGGRCRDGRQGGGVQEGGRLLRRRLSGGAGPAGGGRGHPSSARRAPADIIGPSAVTIQKRSLKIEKLARIYDDEIAPVWGSRFGKLLLRNLTLPARGQVLDISCGTGYP